MRGLFKCYSQKSLTLPSREVFKCASYTSTILLPFKNKKTTKKQLLLSDFCLRSTNIVQSKELRREVQYAADFCQ